jgi:DNA-binding protein H-NS
VQFTGRPGLEIPDGSLLCRKQLNNSEEQRNNHFPVERVVIPLIIVPAYDIALSSGNVRTEGDGMAPKKIGFDSWSLDELWALHGEISGILSARISAEKGELDKRLAVLSRGTTVTGDLGDLQPVRDSKPRRKYPRVLPKFRNPHTSETWSGRGKRPRWLVAAVKSGRKIEEFRISDAGVKARQRA